jgi:hypothetical protein
VVSDMSGADGVDAVLRTFSRDREFCDALAASHAMHVGRLLVYAKWVHNYLTPIQEDLDHMAARHFPAALCKGCGILDANKYRWYRSGFAPGAVLRAARAHF